MFECTSINYWLEFTIATIWNEVKSSSNSSSSLRRLNHENILFAVIIHDDLPPFVAGMARSHFNPTQASYNNDPLGSTAVLSPSILSLAGWNDRLIKYVRFDLHAKQEIR